MRYIFLALFYLTTLLSCNREDEKYVKFVEQYKDENFEAFKNTSMFARSEDHDGGDIIFAYEEPISSSLNNGAYVITIDNIKKEIKSTSCHLMKDSTIVDRKKLERLAIKFIEYPIGYLSVDSNNNVLINLRLNASPNLIRFSDLIYKTEKFREWKKVVDYWYKKVDE